jgi:hypothetical protein
LGWREKTQVRSKALKAGPQSWRRLPQGDRQAMRSNVKREVAGDEPVRPRRRRQTPEERTLDVAAG